MVVVITVFVSLILAAQTPATPRDAVPVREGTAVIRGRVVAADTAAPLRRALVTLFGPPSTPQGRPTRSMTTDGNGRFAFTGLVPGKYVLSAAPGQLRGRYVAANRDGRPTSEPNDPIELAEGQTIDANVALPRSGAITGRVVDEFGEPITGANLRAYRVRGTSFVQQGAGYSYTDDLGRFRLHGLEPGQYIVGAEARGSHRPEVQGTTEGFVLTYFPSTLVQRDASRVSVASAQDTGDLEIQLVRTRTFRVSGSVMDSKGQPVLRPELQLLPLARGSGWSGSVTVEPNGTFTFHDVIPGDYRLNVRPRWYGPADERPSGGEFAHVPVSVAADVENLAIVTQPGVSVAGEIVFAEGRPPNIPPGLRVSAQQADPTIPMFGGQQGAAIDANLGFTLRDLFGPQYIRVWGGARGYSLKAVLAGGTDISDTPFEFKPGHSQRLQVVLTTRTSTLEGTVTDDKGDPVNGATLFMIPEDKGSWKQLSIRFRATGTRKDGSFSIPGVLAGRYFVIAVPRSRMVYGQEANAEFFEPLTKEATTVVIAEDEKRLVDVRLTSGSTER